MPELQDDSDGDRTGWFQRHPEQPLVRVPDLGTRSNAFLQAMVVLLAALLAQILFVSAGLGLLAAVGVTEQAAPVAFFGSQTALGLLAFLAVSAVYLNWRDDPALVGIRRPTPNDVRTILVGFIVFASLMFALEFLLFGLLGFDAVENDAIRQGQIHPELFLVFVPIQFLLTGPGEELLFRGVVQGVLRRAYGVVPAVGFASALFALFHVPALSADGDLLPVLLVLFLSGVVLGALYEYSRTLLVPILVHALWNAVVFGTEYAEAVGVLTVG